ncbi:hypothetical protein [Amycolatopsis mongoliensis]|uniref:hypothetical protein n=1 Tax=Amycolatopsis mongoliensis TaxID=715475 RepID=UPI0038CBFD74
MQQIFSLHTRKKGYSRKEGLPLHDDLVRRDFTATAPNIKWLTDITEHPTGQGELLLQKTSSIPGAEPPGRNSGPLDNVVGRCASGTTDPAQGLDVPR